MKKMIFVLIAAVLIFSCNQPQKQSDFYGKWVWDNDGGKMEYNISAATFTSIWTPSWVTYVSPVEQNTLEIFSWEKIINENEETKDDYPTGFLLGLRHGLGNTTARLFIHRDKNSLINAYENRGVYHQEIYVRPVSQSEFYGMWRMVDDDGKMSELELKFTSNTYTIARTYNPNPLIEEILWESIINNDIETKNDYPSGYHIKVKYNEDDYYSGSNYYLHKNKKNLLMVTTGSQKDKYFFIRM